MDKNQLRSFKLHNWGHIKPGQGYVVGASDMRLNEYYIKIYCIWMNFIFMGLIPFVALIILNAQTLWSLQVSKNISIKQLIYQIQARALGGVRSAILYYKALSIWSSKL